MMLKRFRTSLGKLVVDFNQATNQDGFYAQVESLLSQRRSLILTTLEEPLNPRESYNFGLDSCQRAGESTLYDPKRTPGENGIRLRFLRY